MSSPHYLVRQVAGLFAYTLLRLIVRDVSWMTWNAAKKRITQRAGARRAALGLDPTQPAGLVLSGRSGDDIVDGGDDDVFYDGPEMGWAPDYG